jgi:hypothetical protein
MNDDFDGLIWLFLIVFALGGGFGMCDGDEEKEKPAPTEQTTDVTPKPTKDIIPEPAKTQIKKTTREEEDWGNDDW